MSRLATEVLLGVTVAAVWIGCLGFARLRNVYDRVHCVTFVAVAGGLALTLAAWTTEGASASVLKVAFIALCALVNGAALGHATGRALHTRDKDGVPS